MNIDDAEPAADVEANLEVPQSNPDGDLNVLRRDYEARLLQANLRTEAVRAGMIDLDGLKLIDPSTVRTDETGNIVEGKSLMASLQRKKPWLFGSVSSSSTTPPPASVPVRQKMAIDMSDEEYAAARAALTKHSY
jgi:hypothetical protein